jgi:hypothetical protein
MKKRNALPRIFVMIACIGITFAMTACEGPIGPAGPEGPEGPEGDLGPAGGAVQVWDDTHFIGYLIGDSDGSTLAVYRPTISPATHPLNFLLYWNNGILKNTNLHYASNDGSGDPYISVGFETAPYLVFANPWDGTASNTSSPALYIYESLDVNGYGAGTPMTSPGSYRSYSTGNSSTSSSTGTFYKVKKVTQTELFGFTIQPPIRLVFGE